MLTKLINGNTKYLYGNFPDYLFQWQNIIQIELEVQGITEITRFFFSEIPDT